METDLNKLRDMAYKTACEHGFHDEQKSDSHWLMLVITEISEAVEADRKNKHADIENFVKHTTTTAYKQTDERYVEDFEEFIKDTVEDELADIVIRLLEFGGIKKIDMNIPKWSSPISEVDERIIELGTFDNFCYMLISLLITGRICHISCLIYAILKWCKNKNIDLFQHIEWKMRYNELRPFKNGKNY